MSDSGRERPNCKHGHDSQCPHCAELATIRTQLAAAEARAERMEGALREVMQRLPVGVNFDGLYQFEVEDIISDVKNDIQAALADAPQAMRSGEEMKKLCRKTAEDEYCRGTHGNLRKRFTDQEAAKHDAACTFAANRIMAAIDAIPLTKEAPTDGTK